MRVGVTLTGRWAEADDDDDDDAVVASHTDDRPTDRPTMCRGPSWDGTGWDGWMERTDVQHYHLCQGQGQVTTCMSALEYSEYQTDKTMLPNNKEGSCFRVVPCPCPCPPSKQRTVADFFNPTANVPVSVSAARCPLSSIVDGVPKSINRCGRRSKLLRYYYSYYVRKYGYVCSLQPVCLLYTSPSPRDRG